MRVCRHAWLHVIFMYWATPENIHTIPQTAFWNLKSKGVRGGGGGGVFELEIQRHGGMVTIGIPKVWGGGLDLEFLQETDKIVLHKTLIFGT